MAAPPFGTCLRSGLVSHVSGAFFFVLFSLEKSSVEDRTGGRGNRFFQPLKPVWCSRSIALFNMKHDFHQRKQNRIEYAENQVAKNEAESDQLYLRTKEMASVIPMGQPILLGHHSERRDRNYRVKIDNTMGRSVAAGKKADYYAERAQCIKENDAIFSDDPEALLKLEQKLAVLKGTQVFMKAANRMVKKNDLEGFLKLKFVKAEMWEELTTPEWWGVGFPPFRLTNNNANIKRIEKRITGLKSIADTIAVHEVINGVRIFENRDANRLQLFFDGKPAAEVIKKLKQHGFRWCRSEVAWQRHISNNALFWGRQIANSLTVQSQS